METDQDVDVTVVGAGPVGLVLAAELALAGVSVQVVERRPEPDETIKAGSVNVPTAEALDRRGLLPAAERVHRETLARVRAEFREGTGSAGAAGPRFTGHFAGMMLDGDLVDWSDTDLAAHTAVAGARMVPQREVEALLADQVARLGVPVRRGVEVVGLEQTDGGVVVGTRAGPLRSAWLVGCDGGRSLVRHLAGIDFPGTDPEITGHQAVVDIADPEKLASGWTWSPRGVYCHGPLPGRILTAEFDGAPADRSAPVTVAELQESLRRVSGTDVTLSAVHGGATRWTDNARQAATYRMGRVLLAGDAAHVHSPFGGQGLNLGVGDAMNLGWKLAAVVAGWASEDLLDTYDTERRPLGAWVLDWTRAQIAVMRGDAAAAALREVVADLLATPAGTTYAVKKISGVDQRVDLPGDHPMVGRFVPDLWLHDGSRLVDHGHRGGFLLLDRSEDRRFGRLADSWGNRVSVVTDGPHTAPTAVLVRPDGVVAWARDTPEWDTRDDAPTDPAVDRLADALRRWAGDPGSAHQGQPAHGRVAVTSQHAEE